MLLGSNPRPQGKLAPLNSRIDMLLGSNPQPQGKTGAIEFPLGCRYTRL
jgi:hypothetical protein